MRLEVDMTGVCPKCYGPCNEGAAICYTCGRIINLKKFMKVDFIWVVYAIIALATALFAIFMI